MELQVPGSNRFYTMTKILHILDHSVPVTDGYSVRSENIVRFQSQLGLEPVAVTSARQHDKYQAAYSREVEVVDGIRYYRTEPQAESRWPLVPEFQRLARMTRRIEAVVERERPDVLHAHSPCLWGLAASRVARKRQLPFVYEVRGFWEDALVDSGKTTEKSLRYRLIRAMETRVCRAATIVTAIAHGLRDDLIARGIPGDKIMLAPNGVEADRFERLYPDQDLIRELNLTGKTVVGYIGSLFAWEGVEDLIRAVPEMVREAPETRVLVIGGGEAEGKIRRLVDELGVADSVRLVGRVPHHEVTRFYSIMNVLIYPRLSTRNTELCTPLKPLEAMAMEKAIVGSDVGGIRELLTDGAGLQYRAGDPADLAHQCLSLIGDPALRDRMGHAARAHVVTKRDWKILATGYLKVYAAALGRDLRLPEVETRLATNLQQ